MNISPVKLEAPIKDYIWGGTKLITEFNKKTDCQKAAESWELSTHPDGESIVMGGEFDGLKLSEYIKSNGGELLLGSRAAKFDFFPILIKLIDAKESLSIQVHPSDEYALRVEGEYGKTEMWYIVDCEDDAFIYYGLNQTVTKDELEARIKNNTLLEILNKVPVKKGDVYFIPSGTIHAIGAGILICEVQQNSNSTYRVYDFDRRGADGKPRELHIEKSIAVANLTPAPPIEKATNGLLASCTYFTAEELDVVETKSITVNSSCFRSLVVLNGCGMLMLNGNTLEFKKGDSIFIPAQDGTMELSGEFKAVLSYV